ncbi:uncharacterized protein LOC144054943 isoform X2 [Vanacampus margaritifer]
MMCTAVDNGSIILISDDDEEEKDYTRDKSSYESSLILMEMEDVPQKECILSPSKLDEDLVVTFSRPAELLPHARFDCPKHPFTATDEYEEPVPGNQLLCDQCFCYICDKLAAKCEKWQLGGVCHCNSHKKSNLWNDVRSDTLLGHLAPFKVTLSEVDSHLRQAESMVCSFKEELRLQMASLTARKCPGDGVFYDCTPAYEYVRSFLNTADRQDGRAAAIMRLAAAEEFFQLFYTRGICCSVLLSASATTDKWMLVHRLLSSLQRQMVMDDFTPEFLKKLQDFYRNLNFPPELHHIKFSLDVRPWEDILLVSVLKGQNVDGVRTNRGKKDMLCEDIEVALFRVQRLLDQNRFRELSRYVRVVRTNQINRFLPLKDRAPLFMCMEGNFVPALSVFFESGRYASRIDQHTLWMYLRVLDTATAPKLTVSRAGKISVAGNKWCAIQGATPLPRLQLVRFALKVNKCCPNVYTNSVFWSNLLKIVHVTHQAPGGLPAPTPAFLQEALHTVRLILKDKSSDKLQVPQHFVSAFPDQAMLLLVIGALSPVILQPCMSPIIPLLCTFEKNVWALHWFWTGYWSDMLPGKEQNVAIKRMLYWELEKRAASDEQSSVHVVWPAIRNWDPLLHLKDLLPFLLCLEGQMGDALRMFFPEKGLAAVPTPQTFPLFLRLLASTVAPRTSGCRKRELCAHNDDGDHIKGDVTLSRPQLVHFALKVFQNYPACYSSSQCWISLLNVVNVTDSLESIPEPSPDIMQEAVKFVDSVLLSFSKGLIPDFEIPQHFLPWHLYQAMLLLVTKALRQIILHPALKPIIPILSCFEKSLWALHWFWKYLSKDGCHAALMETIHQELRQTTGSGSVSLKSISHLLAPSSK